MIRARNLETRWARVATSSKYVVSWKLFSLEYFVVCFEYLAMEPQTNFLPGLEKKIPSFKIRLLQFRA